MSEVLRDLLGIYFDSAEKRVDDVPATVSFSLDGTIKGAQNGSLVYDWTISSKDKVKKIENRGYGSQGTHLLPILNDFVEDFYVTTDRYVQTSPERYTFDLIFTVDSQTIQGTVKNGSTLDHLFVEYVHLCQKINKFPAKPSIAVTVTRENNPDHRRAVYNTRRMEAVGGGRNNTVETLDKWFNQITASGGQPHRWRKDRLEFNGLLNRHIASKMKESCLFLIEYFHGKKISKANSLHKVHVALAGFDSNDFGIKDAQLMVKLIKAIENKYDSPYILYEKLQQAGITSKYPLKRWQKKVIDVYNQKMQTKIQEQTSNQ